MLDRKQLMNYAKRNAAPSSAATLLAKKKAEAARLKGPGAPPAPGAPHPAAPHPAAPHPMAGKAGPAMVDSHLGKADATTPASPPGEAPHREEGQPLLAHELVFDAEAEAQAGADEELEDAIASEPIPQGEAAMQAPKWAVDEEKWHEAAEAVGLDVPGIEEKFEEPFVVAAYLYKKLGGTVKAEGVPPAPGAEKLGDADSDKVQA